MLLGDGVVSSATCVFGTKEQVSTSRCAADMDACPILTAEISYLPAAGNFCSPCCSLHCSYQISWLAEPLPCTLSGNVLGSPPPGRR